MIKNEEGITLIELLVSIAIFSVIVSLALSILLFGSRSFHKQTNETNDLLNIRNAIDHLTREIRKSDHVDVRDGILTLNKTDTYRLDNNRLMKNETVIIDHIDEFKVMKSGSMIDITLRGKEGEEVYSTLYIR